MIPGQYMPDFQASARYVWYIENKHMSEFQTTAQYLRYTDRDYMPTSLLPMYVTMDNEYMSDLQHRAGPL